jgi:hypothetical protein
MPRPLSPFELAAVSFCTRRDMNLNGTVANFRHTASPLIGQIGYRWIASFQFKEGPCLPHILQPHWVARPSERGRADDFLRFSVGLASLS